MTLARPMPAELLELVAERFKALAEPARLRILDALRRGERSVGELSEELELHPANASRHLQILHQQGFLERRKAGLHVHYRLADQRVERLCDIMCGKLEEEAAARRKVLGGDDS
jgi:DNA-binding transcriptional ArsR family regulator